MVGAEAGWRADPTGRHEQRYWNGLTWTEHVADGGVRAIDPPVWRVAEAERPVTAGAPWAAPAAATATTAAAAVVAGGAAAPAVHAVPRARGAGGADGGGAHAGGAGGGVVGGRGGAGPGGGGGGWGFLDAMGERARERPRPELSTALAGLAGALLALGVLAFSELDRTPLMVLSAALVLAATVAMFADAPAASPLADLVHATAVGVAVVAIAVLGATLVDGGDDAGTLAGLLVGAMYVAAWALPGFRGRTVMLGLGALTLALTAGSNGTTGAPALPVDASIPSVFGDRIGTQGAIYLAAAAVLLGLVWLLDRAGYHGAATGLVGAGVVTSLLGVTLVVQDAGETGGPLLMAVVGLLVCAVGHHGARRATTWYGAVLTALGVLLFTVLAFEPVEPSGVGTALLTAAGALLVVAALVRVVRPVSAGSADDR